MRGGTPSIVHKFLIPLIFSRYGVDVIWLDFDVWLFQNPTPFFMQHQNSIWGDFGSFAPDTSKAPPGKLRKGGLW